MNKEETVLLASDTSLLTLGTIDCNLIALLVNANLSSSDSTAHPTRHQRRIRYTLGFMLVDESPIHEKLRLMDIAR